MSQMKYVNLKENYNLNIKCEQFTGNPVIMNQLKTTVIVNYVI